MSNRSNFPNNTHIESFLDYYTALTAPHYAVLLTGKWGIGKTFFITRYMEKISPKQEDESEKIPEIIKISLNGVQTKDEIDDMIIKEFHPFMNKKSARLTGKIFSSLLKSQGIDLDHLKTDDLFNIYRPESIYIFDDLERCGMPIEASLGYINSFVENNNCKVIIIGNEEEIAPYADNQKKASYKSIKEKVIGKTLRMMPETENALNYFLEQLQKGEGRKFLKSRRDLIIQMYQTSKLDNLRILQQSLNDFERLYAYLEDKHKKHEMFMKDLVMLFFILSFEIKAGHFSCHYFKEWKELKILKFLNNSSETVDEKKEIEQNDYLEKYGEYFENVIKHNNIFSDDMLTHILEDGFFPEDDIKQELNNLPAYFPSKEPWRNLWHWRDQKSEELDSMLEQFEQDFKERKYSDIGVILHVFGLRLSFSENGLLTQGTVEIEKECRQYIDAIVPSLSEENFDFETSRLTGMYGLGFYKSESEEWLRLKNYLKDKFLNTIKNDFKNSLKNQLLSHQDLTEDQIRKLNNTNFQNISILELCGVSSICNYLKDVPCSQGLELFYIIMNRFYRERTDTKSREWECLQSIRENLDTIQKRASRWDKLKIQNYIQYIDNEASKKIGPHSVTKVCSEEESALSPSHSVEKS
ncbi:MAG TPA: KAP family NTPase [Akkermansia muciniphila]|nr:KAP family NTPase [Akkermansia muciniphila]